MLDVDARELVLPSGRVNLTSLEFGVMQYLQNHPGKAVSRYDLMEAVWGYRNETASNVVDVVVRSLRRKLGVESSAVETVRGTGTDTDASLDTMSLASAHVKVIHHLRDTGSLRRDTHRLLSLVR